MTSFQKLWENIQLSKEKSPKDDRSMSAIRTGIGVRENFWEDFLLVINNSDGLSELLDIPTVKISNWHERVKNALDKVKKIDGSSEPSENGKLLKTGHSDELDPQTLVANSIQ